MESKEKDSDFRIRVTPPIKFKDRNNRNAMAINLKEHFGFVPEVIILEKVKGETNVIRVAAVLTEEEKRKEDSVKATLVK